jgi:glutamine cyclotransferase
VKSFLSIVFLLCLALPAVAEVPIYGYQIVARYPHNIASFTQGLEFHDGFLYEGTGRNGRSTLSKISLEDGEVLQSKRLASRYFGEGISIVGERIFQLTWQSNIVFVHDLASFETLTSFYHPTEGWGLTFDGEQLILSDGSANLQFIDPETFQVLRTVEVTLEGRPIRNLNELEYINGEVWANVWMTNEIVRIDPANGIINSVVDLNGLIDETSTGGSDGVLNGIAWIPNDAPAASAGSGRLFVTGKLWADLFEIEIAIAE